MKLRNSVSLAVASLFSVLAARANIVGYVNDPSANSSDFAAAVGPVTTYTFDTLATGTLDPNAYAGLTFSGNINQVVYSAGPGQGNTFSPPLDSGEGAHPVSNVLESGDYQVVDSLTVDFAAPVAGAGLFVIDSFNIDGTTTTISAYDSSDNLLGSFNGPVGNFQPNNEYFMGISSSTADIASIVFSHNGATTGDTIAVDNLEVAGAGNAPAPDASSTLALLGGTLALARAVRRRLKK